MASYPQSLARLTHPQMNVAGKQPKPVMGKQAGMQSAAARRLQNQGRVNKLKMNNGSY